ncbi:MAG: hypothetical protein PHX38_13060 [Sulfuricella sp.]|nr:hypothetical protein [Sulfuricella sp.]
MDSWDWILLLLLLCMVAVHAFFGVRYRENFEVNRGTLNKSYWQMIFEFKKQHPKAANYLILTVCLQPIIILALVIHRFF